TVELSGERWMLRDHGSRNGSYVDGKRLTEAWSGPAPRVIRIGRTLLLPQEDLGPARRFGMQARGELVLRAALPAAYERIATVGRAGQALLLCGESGTGKELAAQAYHRATERPGGPFVAVNCATIPRDLAERLLFGARRGAYSGAVTDSDGYIQAA